MQGATPPCGKGMTWLLKGLRDVVGTRKAVSRAILSPYQARNRMLRTGIWRTWLSDRACLNFNTLNGLVGLFGFGSRA